jgi:signal transduction histidine kinase
MDALTLTLVGVLVGIGALAVIGGIVAAQRSRRQAAQSISAIDFVRNTFPSRLRRREPLDDLLKQMVEALRDTFGLDRSEVWVAGGGQLRLILSDPPRDGTSIPLSAAEASVVANAKISGSAWARTWLPALVSADSTASARIVPVAHQGVLLGLIVIERAKDGAKLAEQTDATLDELARELGPAWQNAQLDTALEATLEQLRQRAAELQASRARIVEAGDAQRRRIERDLHDGAQQQLVALAIKAKLAAAALERDPTRTRQLLDELHDDVQRAIDEVRALAHGIYPPLLSQEGLGRALEAACRRSAIPAEVEMDGIGRYPPGLEAAVYFSCIEALQNAAKYAGPNAEVRVKLREEGGAVIFEVQDTGAGFDAQAGKLGAGLINIQDRIGALGGTVGIVSRPGDGTRLAGRVPVPQPDPANG